MLPGRWYMDMASIPPRPRSFPNASARKGELARARLDRARRLLALHCGLHWEYVERIGARRMDFADQNRAHQLVVAVAEEDAVGIERDIGGERVVPHSGGGHARVALTFAGVGP